MSTMNYGVHNMTINATRQYFNHSANRTVQSAFVLTSKPILSSPSITPNPNGWGNITHFNVTVIDEDNGPTFDNDQVNVTLSKRLSGGGFTFVNSTKGDFSVTANATFRPRFLCTDVGNNEFKFN